jgi:hypothetical protein
MLFAAHLVESGSLQDVCSVDPIVVTPSHHTLLEFWPEKELIDGDLSRE